MKRIEDPELGTLIGVAEVASLTGITKAQLRNWRKEDQRHLAKIEGYQAPYSRDVWYRLLDVEQYLADHGVKMGQSGFAPIGSPNAVKAPLLNPDFVGAEAEARKALLAINTETVMAYRNKFAEQDTSGGVMAALSKFATPVYKELMPNYDPSKTFVTMDKRYEYPVWFAGATKAMRMYANARFNYNVSEEEIDAMPIGTYPPINEAKRI